MSRQDPRITPARPDLAAAHLEGVVRSEKFVGAKSMGVVRPNASIRVRADKASEQVDQLLFGEIFEQFDTSGGLAWGQARRDGYVGWVEAEALGANIEPPTHWVSALRTFAFAEPSIKSPAQGPLSLNALVTVTGEQDAVVLAGDIGWITRSHLTPIGVFLTEPAGVAERFIGTPYLWGGRDSVGLDCSGLIQQALYACGSACPRDTDMQAALGAPVDPAELRRDDLVFWRGHVGMMIDAERLIHANGHHMAVVIEPLAEAAIRIEAAGGGTPTGFRRL